MRTAYRWLAIAIPVLVAVQAAVMAYAIMGLGSWVAAGHDFNEAAMESQSAAIPGMEGMGVHWFNGQFMIPLVALLLLGVSFAAHVRGGVKLAGLILVDVVLQVVVGVLGDNLPGLGIVHGLNAIVLVALGLFAARRAAEPTSASAEPGVAASLRGSAHV